VLGALLISELSGGLIQAQIRSLNVEGELISNILVEATTTPGDPSPQMSGPAVREVLRRMLPPPSDATGRASGPRVRVFTPQGAVVADTNKLYDRVIQKELEPLAEDGRAGIEDSVRGIQRALDNLERWRLTPWRATVTLTGEHEAALAGRTSFGQRLDESGSRVVSVTMPIRRVEAVLGVVTIESADVERILLAERVAMIPFVVGAALVTFLSSALLGLFVARPLRLLATAADRLRVTGATRLSLPEVSRRDDEIGELSRSIEAMTGALADRIDANERFAGDVSHELKNPMASISSAVETIRAINDQERQKELLMIVAQDVRRLDRLITDIARASRMEAETARGDLVRVDLARLVSDIAESYASAPGETSEVAVAFRGPPPDGAWVLAQEGPLGQVFRNLVDNAKSFSPKDGVVTLRVDVRRGREGQVVRATVEDQGPGIPAENLESVFDRFYTHRPRQAGFGAHSGLGLSIAKQIVSSFSGRVWAENIEGLTPEKPVGARFSVEFPQAGRT
jgi:two-component system sensor histidine kinase ChvG